MTTKSMVLLLILLVQSSVFYVRFNIGHERMQKVKTEKIEKSERVVGAKDQALLPHHYGTSRLEFFFMTCSLIIGSGCLVFSKKMAEQLATGEKNLSQILTSLVGVLFILLGIVH